MLGDRLPAEEALRLGLANRLVPRGQALTVALELATRLAALPPQAVTETKTLLNNALRQAVDSLLSGAIDRETDSFDEPAFRSNLAGMLRRAGST